MVENICSIVNPLNPIKKKKNKKKTLINATVQTKIELMSYFTLNEGEKKKERYTRLEWHDDDIIIFILGELQELIMISQLK